MRRALAALALAIFLPWPALAGSYTVKTGDTLSGIAERYGVTVQRLLLLNGLKSANDLQAGSRLVVPGAGGTPARRAGGGGAGGNYTVQPGDTLSELAERYGVSVDRLLQLNGLKSASDLQAGSKLVLPGGGGASTARRGGGGDGSASYTVKEGDTLSALAERYGVSVDRLIQLNGLKSADDLQAGSKLVVPGPKRPPAVAASQAKAPTIAKGAKEYQVQPGETLSEISQSSGVSIERLIALNNLKDPNNLVIGTRLKLRPSAATAATPAPAVAARPAPKPAATPKPEAKPQPRPEAAAQPKPQPRPAAATPTAAATTATSAPAATPAAAPATTTPAARPATATPVVESQPAVAARPAPVARPTPSRAVVTSRPNPTTTSTAAKAGDVAKASTPDWRTYGPLQVDWANWQPMGGSYVAPSLNSNGQPLYLAINCTARKLNATGQSGAWKTWDAPQTDFESQLVKDLCKAKGL